MSDIHKKDSNTDTEYLRHREVCVCVCVCMCAYMYVHVHVYIYVCICMCIYADTVRGGEAREVRQESNDIPSVAILSDHTVITDHRVMDHTGTGRGGGVREARQGSNDIPSVFHSQ